MFLTLTWTSIIYDICFSVIVSSSLALQYLPLDGNPVVGTASPGEAESFFLTPMKCQNAGHVNIQALNLERKKELVGVSPVGNPRMMLMVNLLGNLPKVHSLGNDVWTWNNGTVVDFKSKYLQFLY